MNNGSSAPENNNGPKPLELNDYDMQRRPHKAITDSTEIRIFPRMLAAELCCPICLDLLTNTMTSKLILKECLHRFCCECITTALMRGNKECPTCRKKLVSKRSLRPDPNFDSLINKIWPDRQVYEKLQEKALEIFQQQSNIKALQKSIEAGMKEQARNRRQRVQGSYDYERRKKRGRPPEHPDRSENNSPISNSPEFSGEGDMEVDQIHERNDDGTIAPGTSGTEPAANGILHSATNSISDSDDSIDSSSDSSLSDSSDDTTDTTSTSSSTSAVQTNSSKIHLQPAQSVDADVLQLPAPSITDSNQNVPLPSTTCTLKDRINKWVEKSLSEPTPPVENMEHLERRVDEELDIADVQSGGNVLDIEAELLPAKSLLKRSGIPPPLLRRRYIRTKGDTTMEHLGEFLYQVCCEELSAEISGDSGIAAVGRDSSSSKTSHDVPRPDHFYVYSRFGGHSVNKIFGNENVLSALHAQKRGDHLMIFFDTSPLDIHSKSVLDEVVYGDFLK